MSDRIILSADDFQKIFANAYAVVIDGCICDVYNDYENEDGELCTAFVESNDFNYEVAYVISRDVEKGRVSYDPGITNFTLRTKKIVRIESRALRFSPWLLSKIISGYTR